MNTLLLCMLVTLPASRGPERHGIRITVTERAPAVVATFSYDGDAPVVAGEVVITAPGSAQPFQTGRADANGIFAFVPDAPGTWKVTVDDGLGHTRSRAVEIGAAFFAKERAGGVPPAGTAGGGAAEGIPLWARAALGVALIAGITWALYTFKTGRMKGGGEPT